MRTKQQKQKDIEGLIEPLEEAIRECIMKFATAIAETAVAREKNRASEVSSTGLLSVELSLDELARITSWGAGMQTMPDCYWDSESRKLWNRLMKIRTDNVKSEESKNEKK